MLPLFHLSSPDGELLWKPWDHIVDCFRDDQSILQETVLLPADSPTPWVVASSVDVVTG